MWHTAKHSLPVAIRESYSSGRKIAAVRKEKIETGIPSWWRVCKTTGAMGINPMDDHIRRHTALVIDSGRMWQGRKGHPSPILPSVGDWFLPLEKCPCLATVTITRSSVDRQWGIRPRQLSFLVLFDLCFFRCSVLGWSWKGIKWIEGREFDMFFKDKIPQVLNWEKYKSEWEIKPSLPRLSYPGNDCKQRRWMIM